MDIVTFFRKEVVGKEVRINNKQEKLTLDGIVTTCDNSDINFLVVGNGMQQVKWDDVDVLEIVEGK